MGMDDTHATPATPDDLLDTDPGARRNRRPLLIGLVVAAGVIAAAAVAVARSGSADTTTAAPAPAPAPATTTIQAPAPTPPAISGLTATPGSFQVTLTWLAAPGSKPLGSFRVVRGGTAIATGPATEGSYVDRTVAPGTSYSYTVTLYDAASTSSAPAVTTVRTKSAPARLARLDGIYDVRMTRTAIVGATGFGKRETSGWRLRPRCTTGACRTSLRDIHVRDVSMVLALRHGVYTGTATIHGLVTCSHAPATSAYAVTLHPSKARMVGDAWTVTVVLGTIHVDTVQQLGCVASHITYAVRGRLVAPADASGQGFVRAPRYRSPSAGRRTAA